MDYLTFLTTVPSEFKLYLKIQGGGGEVYFVFHLNLEGWVKLGIMIPCFIP